MAATPTPTTDTKLTILVIGAHPDDPDIASGGTAIRFADAGHRVVFVAMTNGATGHHEIGGIELARRRAAEAQASAKVAGIAEYRILDHHTGELEPSVHFRKEVIRIIREIDPDLIFTHRPYDYHPDHRYTAQLVLDASYIVTVPNMLPLTPIPKHVPRICYQYDRFTKPCRFVPDVVVPIDEVLDRKFAMLDCHESQFYEWIPFNRGVGDEVPSDRKERLEWFREVRLPAFAEVADRCREKLVDLYGAEYGGSVRYAEAFEGSEYGGGFEPSSIAGLFPFLADRLVASK
jgi:LmbE family N-acetylglucosaminyl deacetylase